MCDVCGCEDGSIAMYGFHTCPCCGSVCFTDGYVSISEVERVLEEDPKSDLSSSLSKYIKKYV